MYGGMPSRPLLYQLEMACEVTPSSSATTSWPISTTSLPITWLPGIVTSLHSCVMSCFVGVLPHVSVLALSLLTRKDEVPNACQGLLKLPVHRGGYELLQTTEGLARGQLA